MKIQQRHQCLFTLLIVFLCFHMNTFVLASNVDRDTMTSISSQTSTTNNRVDGFNYYYSNNKRKLSIWTVVMSKL